MALVPPALRWPGGYHSSSPPTCPESCTALHCTAVCPLQAEDQAAWGRQRAAQQQEWLLRRAQQQQEWLLQQAQEQQRWEQHRQLQEELWEQWKQRQRQEWERSQQNPHLQPTPRAAAAAAAAAKQQRQQPWRSAGVKRQWEDGDEADSRPAMSDLPRGSSDGLASTLIAGLPSGPFMLDRGFPAATAAEVSRC